MNNCFLSSVDSFDMKNWHGTLSHITNSLAKQNSIEWIWGYYKILNQIFLQNKNKLTLA
jgi:hypothetical protein